MSEQSDSLSAISSYLENEFGMNADETGEILDIFFEESEALVLKIGESIEKSDASELVMSAHALKGSAANINAAIISELALEIEAAAKSGDVPRGKELFPALETAFGKLRNEYASKN